MRFPKRFSGFRAAVHALRRLLPDVWHPRFAARPTPRCDPVGLRPLRSSAFLRWRSGLIRPSVLRVREVPSSPLSAFSRRVWLRFAGLTGLRSAAGLRMQKTSRRFARVRLSRCYGSEFAVIRSGPHEKEGPRSPSPASAFARKVRPSNHLPAAGVAVQLESGRNALLQQPPSRTG